MNFTDDEWKVVEGEVPSTQDAVIQEYLAKRTTLIAQEASQRSDAAFKASLSPTADRASRIVDAIRHEELASIWTGKTEDAIARAEHSLLYPGMMFTHAKGLMEGTRLWEIVKRVPKGGLLHAHMEACVDFEYMFGKIIKVEGMCFAAEGSLETERKRDDLGIFFRYREEPGRGMSVWEEGYEAMTYLSVLEVADSFPEGGREGFVRWCTERCTLAVQDSEEQFRGVDHIWDKFLRCFLVTRESLHYEPVTRIFFRRLMQELYDDGVMWAELRFVWPTHYYAEKSEIPEKDNTLFLRIVEQELAAFKTAHPDFWGLRFICTTIRGFPTRMITAAMHESIQQKIAFPHLIAGFDLVGPEDRGKPLIDLLPELEWFKRECRKADVNMPFFFHAGETLGDGDATDQNLFDAVLLDTRRIGHGFSLFKHPLLIKLINEKKILIESCPISNEVLRLTGSIMSHPLPALLARGVACCLCNDDPAMLGQGKAGISHDFWQALQGWENLGLAGLGSLAENSVRWGCFEDEDAEGWVKGVSEGPAGRGVKAERLRDWKQRWEGFCEWVMKEYGGKYEKLGSPS